MVAYTVGFNVQLIISWLEVNLFLKMIPALGITPCVTGYVKPTETVNTKAQKNSVNVTHRIALGGSLKG